MLAMAAACLPCAVQVWRTGLATGARMLMGMTLAMAAFHAALLLWPGPGGHHHHRAQAGVGAAAGAGTAAAGGAVSGAEMMLAIIALELVTAMLAATLLRRLRLSGLAAGSARSDDVDRERTHCADLAA